MFSAFFFFFFQKNPTGISKSCLETKLVFWITDLLWLLVSHKEQKQGTQDCGRRTLPSSTFFTEALHPVDDPWLEGRWDYSPLVHASFICLIVKDTPPSYEFRFSYPCKLLWVHSLKVSVQVNNIHYHLKAFHSEALAENLWNPFDSSAQVLPSRTWCQSEPREKVALILSCFAWLRWSIFKWL